MKYVILKNSLSLLCVQLPEGFGRNLEIICCESQTEFEEFLKVNKKGVCPISFPQTPVENEEASAGPPIGQDGFFIRQNEYYKKVLFNDIMWIEASRSYCYIHLADDTRIIVTYPLSEVKKKLPDELFIQTHRSYVVNIQRVDKFIGNMLYIGKHSLPISRRLKDKVLEQFLFLDNISETLGKQNQPPGKNNLPLENKIMPGNNNDVNSGDETKTDEN